MQNKILVDCDKCLDQVMPAQPLKKVFTHDVRSCVKLNSENNFTVFIQAVYDAGGRMQDASGSLAYIKSKSSFNDYYFKVQSNFLLFQLLSVLCSF